MFPALSRLGRGALMALAAALAVTAAPLPATAEPGHERTQRDAAEAPAAQQAQLGAAADELFRSALVGWSIAATELDDLAVAHDLGHVHLYLTDDPGTGAITSHEGREEEGVQP